ncbi:MAG: hypothetical protein HY718_04095, partial [Planctomycetes bacterium]|nr:hypothetical protein [Planctomycetota bacterium]
LYLVLVFHQRVLVQEEQMETEQLRREREAGLGGGAIFDQEDLLLAQRRLRWMYRWLLPGSTILVLVGLAITGLSGWPWTLGDSIRITRWPGIKIDHATLAIWFTGGAAFLSFLLSRYASGMGRYPEWRMLRSGASWLMGVTLGAVAVSATMAPLHYTQAFGPERVLAYVLRILLLVLAAEVLFNFVLDFYRPRSPDEEPRPAFDSRLLGLFSEPGGIARSIADAVNYQFGFEVSSTWLYKLLERAAVPLVGFAVIMLFVASSFVVVQAEEEAIIERFGRPLESTVGPGLHLKRPWPIDVAYKVATRQIHEYRLGDAPSPDAKKEPEGQLILWTNKHEQEPHLKVLIATPKLAEFMTTGAATRPAAESHLVPGAKEGPTFAETGAAVSVTILRVATTIQYEIGNAKDWISTYRDPEAMLRAIASNELTRLCASQTVDGMLGNERGRLEKLLWQQVQDKADEAKLGVQVKFLGLQGVHPPEETAEAFQDVIGAEQKKMASIRSAWADYNKRLSEVAGDMYLAENLATAIQTVNQREADSQASAQARQEARDLVHKLFFGDTKAHVTPIGGQAAGIISKARAQRWQLENQGHAQAALFEQARAIKDAAPRVFYVREKLSALADALKSIRKYVIAAEGNVRIGTFHLNLQDAANAPLDYAAGSESP